MSSLQGQVRRMPAILCVVLGLAGAVEADQLVIRKVPYPALTVEGVAEGQISYRVPGARTPSRRPLTDVDEIALDGQAEFNQAEQLAKGGKAVEAVAAYDRAARKFAAGDWQMRLIRYRRLRALNESGQPGRAVEEWLGVVDADGVSRDTLACAPTRLGARGSPTNAEALKALESRLAEARDTALAARIKQLLLELYAVEGLDDKAAKLRGDGGSAGGAAKPDVVAVAAPPEGLSRQLQEAAGQVRDGRYVAAAAAIRGRLRAYSGAELPKALLLMGKANLLAYEKGVSKTPATLAEAGLSFMRVAGCCEPSLPEVPEALFWAARVCELMGNKVAAQNAYRLLIERHGDSEWAQKARKALESGGGAAVEE